MNLIIILIVGALVGWLATRSTVAKALVLFVIVGNAAVARQVDVDLVAQPAERARECVDDVGQAAEDYEVNWVGRPTAADLSPTGRAQLTTGVPSGASSTRLTRPIGKPEKVMSMPTSTPSAAWDLERDGPGRREVGRDRPVDPPAHPDLEHRLRPVLGRENHDHAEPDGALRRHAPGFGGRP